MGPYLSILIIHVFEKPGYVFNCCVVCLVVQQWLWVVYKNNTWYMIYIFGNHYDELVIIIKINHGATTVRIVQPQGLYGSSLG